MKKFVLEHAEGDIWT